MPFFPALCEKSTPSHVNLARRPGALAQETGAAKRARTLSAEALIWHFSQDADDMAGRRALRSQ
eukprot:6193246-Pleurochrysis_carterae.AAC.2